MGSSSNPHPWSLCQSCIEALSPPAQVFCQSLTHSSELPQYYSPAWQSQGWVWSWSPSSSHLLHELWDVTHRVQFMPWLFLCHPWLPSPFRAVCCFHIAFSLTVSMQSSQETKKKKPSIASYTRLFTALQQNITCLLSLVTADKTYIEVEELTYRFTLFMLPWNNSFILSSTLFRSCKQ